jgi:hypothetical protein
MVRTRRTALIIFLYLQVFKGNYLIDAFALLAVYSTVKQGKIGHRG